MTVFLNFSMASYYILVFLIALVVSFAMTPLAIKIAHKIKAVDCPKNERKIHTKIMPRFGISMFIGFFVATMVFCFIAASSKNMVVDIKLVGYIIGLLIIMAVCTVDDIKGVRARYKLIAQIIASIVVVSCGVHIGNIEIPFSNGEYIDFGVFSYIITILWIIGVTNAINLIDGLDGLAAGVSTISAISLLFIFLLNPMNVEATVITSALVGATLGFLPFNFNPAKIFMGDTGSNFLGFTLAVVSILGLAKGYTFVVIVAPICVLGLPIFDTLFAIIRRMAKGKHIMEADRGHLHHKLLDRGFTQKQVVLVCYTITSILGVIALILVRADMSKVIIMMSAVFIFISVTFISIGNTKDLIEKEKEENKK